MNKRYWDRVGNAYDREIFDSLASDRRGVILSNIHKYRSRRGIACDVGCAVGKYLPALATRFAHVHAVDMSPVCLEQAKQACARFPNISYHQRDVSKSRVDFPRPEFVTCINVLIMPGRRTRAALLHNIVRHMKPGGHAVFVVPSLESVLYANHLLVEWNLRNGLTLRQAWNAGLASRAGTSDAVVGGVVPIDGVATKHYVREELVTWLRTAGFRDVIVEKVEYPWSTEFNKPPRWMRDPYPWDWMAVCRRP